MQSFKGIFIDIRNVMPAFYYPYIGGEFPGVVKMEIYGFSPQMVSGIVMVWP